MSLTFTQFSYRLIQSGDLDPDYIFMHEYGQKNQIDQPTMVHWIFLKVFLYYTPSEMNVLFGHQTIAGQKLGAERRKQARFIEDWFKSFRIHVDESKLQGNYSEVSTYLMTFKGIGSWAAWKMCDLLERVAGFKIDFTGVDFRKAYNFPLKGLLMVNGLPEDLTLLADEDKYDACIAGAWKQFEPCQELLAHPRQDRSVAIQELETCLCKYHSYIHKHYRPMEDINRLATGLHAIKISLEKYFHV